MASEVKNVKNVFPKKSPLTPAAMQMVIFSNFHPLP
jgi:hypothetical protein